MTDHKYTPADLVKIAEDRGPQAVGMMRQALKWCADVLVAADAAVQSETRRAEKAETELKQLRSRP